MLALAWGQRFGHFTLIQRFAGPKLRRLCDASNAWTDARRLKALAHRLDPDMGRLVSESRIKRCSCLPMFEPFAE